MDCFLVVQYTLNFPMRCSKSASLTHFFKAQLGISLTLIKEKSLNSAVRQLILLQLGSNIIKSNPNCAQAGVQNLRNSYLHLQLSSRRKWPPWPKLFKYLGLKSEGIRSCHDPTNDLIRRFVVTAGFPSVPEPPNTSPEDGRRPDGKALLTDATPSLLNLPRNYNQFFLFLLLFPYI